MATDTDSRTSQLSTALQSDYVLEFLLKEFHGSLAVDTTNVCNAKCVFCAYPFNDDPKAIMKTDLFKKVVDSALEMGSLTEVSLTPMAGDPLVNRNLWEQVAYLQAKGLRVVPFNTNGIALMQNDNYKKLIDSNIEWIGISAPAFEPDYYKKVFGVDKCLQLVDGLVALAEYKKSKGATCRTVISVCTGATRPSSELMQLDTWKRLKPYFDEGILSSASFKSVDELFALIDAKFAKYEEEERNGRKPNAPPEILGNNPYGENTVDNWSGTVSEAVPDNWTVREPSHTAADPPCWCILENLAVLPNGKVRVCRYRYMKTTNDELIIGDLNEKPMTDIYYGDKHKALIKDIASGKSPEVCLKCSLYKPVAIHPTKLEMLCEEAARHAGEAVESQPMNDRDLLPAAQFALRLGDRMLAIGDAHAAWVEYSRALNFTVALARQEQQKATASGARTEANMRRMDTIVQFVRFVQNHPGLKLVQQQLKHAASAA